MKKNRNLLKTCAALTAAALFAAGLAACGEDTASSGTTIGGKEALVLQTDSDLSLFLYNAVDAWNQGGASLSDDFMPVEVEKLPTDSEARAAALQQTRTELMAGSGADLFLFTMPSPMGSEEPAESLFSDPNQTFRSGVFADLSDYTKDDPAFAACVPEVMAAGAVDGRQVALPLSYSWAFYYATQENLDLCGIADADLSQGPAEVAETLEGNAKGVGNAPFFATYILPALPQPVDYDAGSVLVTKDEIASLLTTFRSLAVASSDASDTAATEESGTTMTTPFLTYTPANAQSDLAEGQTPRCFPYLSTDGTVSAVVNTFAAVRGNCEHLESAYAFLSFLLSDEQQKEIDPRVEWAIPVNANAQEAAAYAAIGVQAWDVESGNITDAEKAAAQSYLDSGKPLGSVRILTDADWQIANMVPPYGPPDEIDAEETAANIYAALEANASA